jgi:aspartyl-tRNA(Asn)/glutamyl-tRNA(Gln) amidotransferase subunit C
MPLDRDNVRAIAHLARVKVPEEALDSLAGELNNILGWVEQLDEVDTDGVPPMTSVVATKYVQRNDVVDDGGIVEDVLANAPERVDGFFVVPKVVE